MTSALRLKKYVSTICYILKQFSDHGTISVTKSSLTISAIPAWTENSRVNFDMPNPAGGSRPQAPASPDGPPPGVRSVHPHMREAPIVESQGEPGLPMPVTEADWCFRIPENISAVVTHMAHVYLGQVSSELPDDRPAEGRFQLQGLALS